jgi:CBS domain-containing protein
VFVRARHGARWIALREILGKFSERGLFDEDVERFACALRACARVAMACALQIRFVMDTRSRTENASWLRRSSWKLGALFGRIAKRLAGPSIPISAVILARSSTTAAAVSPDQPIEDVAQLLVAGRVSEMPVMARGVALGMITRDAVGETLEHDGPHTPVGLVSLSDVVVVEPNAPLDDVIAELDGHPGAVALVLDHGSPLGTVTRDELDAYLEKRAA